MEVFMLLRTVVSTKSLAVGAVALDGAIVCAHDWPSRSRPKVTDALVERVGNTIIVLSAVVAIFIPLPRTLPARRHRVERHHAGPRKRATKDGLGEMRGERKDGQEE